MNQISPPASTNLPNENHASDAARLINAGQAGLLSYFGIFGKILRNLIIRFEALSPPHHSAMSGPFCCLRPNMAIV
jgi:hypothetical protein